MCATLRLGVIGLPTLIDRQEGGKAKAFPPSLSSVVHGRVVEYPVRGIN